MGGKKFVVYVEKEKGDKELTDAMNAVIDEKMGEERLELAAAVPRVTGNFAEIDLTGIWLFFRPAKQF